MQWVHISTARQSGVCSRVSRRQSYSRLRVTSNSNTCNHPPIKLTLANPIQRVILRICAWQKVSQPYQVHSRLGQQENSKHWSKTDRVGWGQSFGLPTTMCAITCFIRASEQNTHHCHRLSYAASAFLLFTAVPLLFLFLLLLLLPILSLSLFLFPKTFIHHRESRMRRVIKRINQSESVKNR